MGALFGLAFRSVSECTGVGVQENGIFNDERHW